MLIRVQRKFEFRSETFERLLTSHSLADMSVPREPMTASREGYTLSYPSRAIPIWKQEHEKTSSNVCHDLNCPCGTSPPLSPLCVIISILWRFTRLLNSEKRNDKADVDALIALYRKPRAKSALEIKHSSLRHDRIVNSAQKEIEACYNGLFVDPDTCKEDWPHGIGPDPIFMTQNYQV